MAVELDKRTRRCRLCDAEFTSVNGAVTCLDCMRELAAKFWAAMAV